MKFSASARIKATPDVIWSILTDASRYTEWDPGVHHLEGRIGSRERFKVFTKADPKRAFGIRVTQFNAPRAMTWSGGMPLGLFKGERTFKLTPRSDGTTDFEMQEVFSGPMLRLIGKRLPDLKPVFEKFAAALKKRAEARS